jgi:hypothetical protein
MLSWPLTIQIFMWSDPADMIKRSHLLAHRVEFSLAPDPLSGYLFVFRSCHGDRITILY